MTFRKWEIYIFSSCLTTVRFISYENLHTPLVYASLKDPFTCLTSSHLASTLYHAWKISALFMVEINKLINPSCRTLRIKLPHSVGQDNLWHLWNIKTYFLFPAHSNTSPVFTLSHIIPVHTPRPTALTF